MGTTRCPRRCPILPLKDSVPFPETLTPLAVGQERSVTPGERRAGRQPDARDGRLARRGDREPGPDQIYRRGGGRHGRADDQGARRDAADPGARRPAGASSASSLQSEPYLVAKVAELPDEVSPSPELEALFRNVQSTFSKIIEEVPYLPEELQVAVANLEDPAELAHMIAGALRIKTEERQELLEELDVAKRLRRLSELLARELRADLDRDARSSRRSSPRSTRASASSSCASSSRRSRRSWARSTRPRPRRPSCASRSRPPSCPSTR